MHGLKDILVRESDKRARETADLRVHVDAGIASVEEALDREVSGEGEHPPRPATLALDS